MLVGIHIRRVLFALFAATGIQYLILKYFIVSPNPSEHGQCKLSVSIWRLVHKLGDSPLFFTLQQPCLYCFRYTMVLYKIISESTECEIMLNCCSMAMCAGAILIFSVSFQRVRRPWLQWQCFHESQNICVQNTLSKRSISPTRRLHTKLAGAVPFLSLYCERRLQRSDQTCCYFLSRCWLALAMSDQSAPHSSQTTKPKVSKDLNKLCLIAVHLYWSLLHSSSTLCSALVLRIPKACFLEDTDLTILLHVFLCLLVMSTPD